MISVIHSIGLIDCICITLLDLTPILSHLLPTTLSYLYAFHESLGDIRGYHPSFDRYCAYVEDMSGKIMLNTVFDHGFNFFYGIC